MIKNYSTYIKESIDDEEINFIPFKLREELDPDFTWNEESEKIAYGEKKGCERTLEENPAYMKEMKKRLIGKNVIFYSFNYRDETIKKCHCIISDILFNSRGILVLISINNSISGALDERKPITSFVFNRKYSELDPYDEEDWEND